MSDTSIDTEPLKNEDIRKLLLVILIPVIAMIIGYFISVVILSDPSTPGHGKGSGSGSNSSSYNSLKTAILFGNMGILLFIIYRYYEVFKDTSASFAAGLIMVFTVFFIQNALALPFIIQEFGYSGQGLGPFWVYPEILELIALMIFSYISE